MDAPFIRVKKEALYFISEALQLQENATVYDLGCGDAKVLSFLVKQNPKIKGVGIEKNIFPYLLAKWNTRKLPVTISYNDILNSDVKGATHVFVYLFPGIMQKLYTKLVAECKPGTRIVSCDFTFNNVTPDKVIDLPKTRNPLGKKLYIYTL